MREVEVKIRDIKYHIKTSATQEEMDEILAELNNTMDRVSKDSKTVSTHKIAILTSLLTTAENYVIKRKIDFLIKKISEVCN